MCEFVSWIEAPSRKKDAKQVWFLTAPLIFGTEKGKALQEWCGSPDDYTGHGAIRWYYGLEPDQSRNRECSDFSSPKNFPSLIVAALLWEDFRGLASPPLALMSPQLIEDYLAKLKALDEDYWGQLLSPTNRSKAWQ